MLIAVCLLVLVIIVGFGAITFYYLTWSPYSGWIVHVAFAADWRATGSPVITYLVFHALTLSVAAILPLSLGFSAWLVGVGVYLGIAFILYRWLLPLLTRHPLGTLLTLITVLALMVVAPLPFLTPNQLYIGYIGVSTYHNPTTLMLKPFALLSFAFTLRALGGTLTFNARTAICTRHSPRSSGRLGLAAVCMGCGTDVFVDRDRVTRQSW
jgi:hypothetical protein